MTQMCLSNSHWEANNQRTIYSLMYFTAVIQPRNYQVSKLIVYEIEFGEKAVIQIYKTICGMVTGILILDNGRKCKLQNSFPDFQ